jgi:hypothetical protein
MTAGYDVPVSNTDDRSTAVLSDLTVSLEEWDRVERCVLRIVEGHVHQYGRRRDGTVKDTCPDPAAHAAAVLALADGDILDALRPDGRHIATPVPERQAS